ncbi:MAG TPA: flagellar motor protein MotB, partial [Myxococcales bacterium]|nr:flagellar motor protein MotB [Myxococcales bacterium]
WGDRDGDGLKDNVDKCPDKVGPKENKGCPWPDTDGDGLTDNVDKCPKKKGPKSNNGCPWGDRDGDGLKDNVDKCPDKAGPKENKGCPWPDTDGDGVLDKDDRCPKKKGPKEFKGCPDSDKDKIPDPDDKCPYVPGVKERNGCPKVVLVKVTKKSIQILKKIFFRTGSARIRRRSYPVLNQVVTVLKNFPKIRVRVEGHTDNVGSKKYNKGLSQRRAKSVRRFLMKKGIDAGRLESEGYGMEKPLVPNNSRKNRAKNRRVEFNIISQ